MSRSVSSTTFALGWVEDGVTASNVTKYTALKRRDAPFTNALLWIGKTLKDEETN